MVSPPSHPLPPLLLSLLLPGRVRASPTLAKRSLANTNFGQTKFGQHQLWSRHQPTLAKPSLANTILVLQGRVGSWFGWWSGSGLQTQKHEAPKGGAPQVGPVKRTPQVGPEHSRFFFPLPPHVSFSLPSLEGLLEEYWWCFCAGTIKCARLEFSGCRVKPRRPQSSTLRLHSLRAHILARRRNQIYGYCHFFETLTEQLYFNRFTC